MPRHVNLFAEAGEFRISDTHEQLRLRRAFRRGLRKYGVCLKCAKVIYAAACHNVVKTNWRGMGFKLDKECSEAFLIFLHETPAGKNRYVDAVRVVRPTNDSARDIAEKVYNET